MKQLLLSLMILSGFGIGVCHASNPVIAGKIAGSAHDFSGSVWSRDEICLACHTPHRASTTAAVVPLWNHKLTQQTYVPYQSNTLQAAVGQPDGISKLCLSCHDGTVALDAFGGSDGAVNGSGGLVNQIGSQMGPDLNSAQGHSLVHPVSFVYDSALADADGGLIDPTQPQASLGGATIQSKLLSASKLQCSSCHDVHNGGGIPGMLRLSLNNDELCLACHKGK